MIRTTTTTALYSRHHHADYVTQITLRTIYIRVRVRTRLFDAVMLDKIIKRQTNNNAIVCMQRTGMYQSMNGGVQSRVSTAACYHMMYEYLPRRGEGK